MTGAVREARGHRYAGGSMGRGHTPCGWGPERERHAAAVIGVIAALAAAYAAYSASQAQAAQLEYQQDVAEQQAKASREAAAAAEESQREQAAHIQAAQRSRIGASGILGDVGSPLLAQMESAANAELDARRIRFAGETQAKGFESEGILRGFEAKNTRRQGYINAGASLLAGASSAYGTYSKNNPGGGSSGSTGRSEGAYQSYRAGERRSY